MRLRRVAHAMTGLALAFAPLVLTACAHQTPQSAQLSEGKAVAGLWSSLGAASAVADTAVKTGNLKGPKAAAVADDLEKAAQVIAAADTAYHASPAADVSAQVAQAATLISHALCIAKPTPGCPVS